MDDDKQTVVTEPEAGAQPPVEDQGAQDNQEQDVDWDELLSQFDETSTTESSSGTPKPENSEDTALLQRLEQLEARTVEFETEAVKQDIQELVKAVGGETDLPAFAVRGFIDEQSERDPRIQEAFNQRKTNPAAFKRVTAALTREFAKANKGRIDPDATNTDAAVTAALRGSQTTAPDAPPPDYSKLSNGEYREKVMNQWGFDPGV